MEKLNINGITSCDIRFRQMTNNYYTMEVFIDKVLFLEQKIQT